MAPRKKKKKDLGRLATPEETDAIWSKPINATTVYTKDKLLKDAKTYHKNKPKPKQGKLF